MSPHGRVREWALFTMALDADRARRFEGLSQPEKEPLTAIGRRPMASERWLQVLRTNAGPTVQATVFTGG